MVDFEGLNIKINFFALPGFTRLYMGLNAVESPVRNRGSRVELIQIIGFDSNLPMRMTLYCGKSSKIRGKSIRDWPTGVKCKALNSNSVNWSDFYVDLVVAVC